MTESFHSHLWINNGQLGGREATYLPLLNIFVAAMENARFSRLLEVLSHTTCTAESIGPSVMYNVSALKRKAKLPLNEELRELKHHKFDDYIKASTFNLRLSHGCSKFIAISSKCLTMTFTVHDQCSMYITTDDGIESFDDLDINELDVIMQLLCHILGIEIFKFPNLWHSGHTYEHCFHIFHKMMECFQSKFAIFDSQITYLTSDSAFFLNLWGQFGPKVLAHLTMNTSKYLTSNLLYDSKLLSLTRPLNGWMANGLRFISVKPAGLSGRATHARYQFHLVLRLPTAELASRRVHIDDDASTGPGETSLSLLSLLVHQLPVEIQEKIIDDRALLTREECFCNNLKCIETTHTDVCRRRTSILNDKKLIMFPISSRTTNTRERKFTEIYVVITTLVRNCIMYTHQDFSDTLFLMENKCHSKMVVMDRLHFQGNVFDMNLVNLCSLKFMDNDHHGYNYLGKYNGSDVRNPFYDPNLTFNPIRAKCDHREQFVPEMGVAKRHYLFFD